MANWDDVLAAGTRLTGVEVGTSFDASPALKVGKKLICRLRTDPDALALRVPDLAEKEGMLGESPDVFFTIPHYDGHAYVLVHLRRIEAAELAELIEDTWRVLAPKRVVAAHDASHAG